MNNTYTYREFEKDCKEIMPNQSINFWMYLDSEQGDLNPLNQKIKNVQIIQFFSLLEAIINLEKLNKLLDSIVRFKKKSDIIKVTTKAKKIIDQYLEFIEYEWTPAFDRIINDVGTNNDRILFQKRLSLYNVVIINN